MNPSAVLLNRAEHHPGALSGEELEYLLGMEDPEELKRLFEAAYRVKLRCSGKRVHLRGLIEMFLLRHPAEQSSRQPLFA